MHTFKIPNILSKQVIPGLWAKAWQELAFQQVQDCGVA